MTTDRTDQRERLIAAIEAARHRFQALGNEVFAHTFDDWIADAILTEFPALGQQPRLDPALRGELMLAIENYAYQHIQWDKHHEETGQYPNLEAMKQAQVPIMALIDAIAPAAQPQIDREALARVLHKAFRETKLFQNVYENEADAVIAYLNAAPAAQPLWNGSKDRVELFARRYASAYYDFKIGSPDSVMTGDFVDRKLTELLNLIAHAAQLLPTRSQLQELIDKRSWDSGFPSVPAGYLLRDMIAAGYAIEDPEDDEPDPQVGEVDFDDLTLLCNQILAMDELELGAWMDNADAYQVRALAKAVAERGGS